MACDNQVGVKNILLTFHDCDTGETLGPISHELASTDLPTIRMCNYTNEALTGGYVSRSLGNAGMEMNVIRDPRVPLAYYQGCASVDAQIEYFNGLVYTGLDGSVTGDDLSDTHDVTFALTFRQDIDEMLPAGQLDANAPVAVAA